jgi:hypothetical protein
MASTNYYRVLLLSVLLLLQGCVGQGRGYYYEPNPDAFPVGPIIEFSANKNIDLINVQVSAENVVFARRRRTRDVPELKVVANRKAWTDTAIGILQRELNSRLTRVVKGAEKKLVLSVEHVSAESGIGMWRCVVSMQAETGDGYVKMFNGEAQSGSIFRAADAAMIRAVAEVLKDYEIWKYRQE